MLQFKGKIIEQINNFMMIQMPKWQSSKTCSQKAEILRRYRRFVFLRGGFQHIYLKKEKEKHVKR